MSLPVVAIVGRPNVGKSTLFNRLVGKRVALVDDRPGVTRDRREGEGQLLGLEFRVMDTAGFEEVDPASLPGRMRQQRGVLGIAVLGGGYPHAKRAAVGLVGQQRRAGRNEEKHRKRKCAEERHRSPGLVDRRCQDSRLAL